METKLKVLIVDDNERFCDNLGDILDLKGYDILGVHDGYQAIEAVKNQKFDIALLDIKMPGLNGVETVKILKDIAPDISVIMITAFTDDSVYKDELKNIDFKVMQKPMDIDKLCMMLENIR
ncbi:MAG: response regulator [bacterium]